MCRKEITPEIPKEEEENHEITGEELLQSYDSFSGINTLLNMAVMTNSIFMPPRTPDNTYTEFMQIPVRQQINRGSDDNSSTEHTISSLLTEFFRPD
jgi:hypothetical protein